MNYATIGRAGKLIEAARAAIRRDYTCPSCRARVFLRRGSIRDAHFAHYPGEGKPECEQYHPYHPGTGIPPTRTPQRRDSDESEELRLTVEHEGSEWTLLLHIPEVPNAELG